MNENNSVLIRSIEKNVVNQICSGQVILSLATAVKELVENSVDANATSIQIRLKEYGSEMVEVTDNGHGVEEKNFQALTLKHHTSKISDFSDVAGVETFGFRGEALSSLCNLSKVSIITRHKDALSGTKLKFDHNGIIVDSSKIARQTGTTVILENIFYSLPVRHKEFLRNIKKEFTKMCNVLYSYGLLSKGISISCINQVSNKKITVMETKGETIKSNITQIFGAKQIQNLIELKEFVAEDVYEEECAGDEADKNDNCVNDFKLEGFISSCAHGCGRSSSDRQFYYINSRPVDNSKVMKLVNETYRQYNPHQYPFIVMNMKILMKNVDVNVTPDKRVILLKNEKLLLSIIASSLRNIFQNIPAVVTLQNVGIFSREPSDLDQKPSECYSRREEKEESPLERLKKFRCNLSTRRENEEKMEKSSNKPRKARSIDVASRIPSVKDMFFTRKEPPPPSSTDNSTTGDGNESLKAEVNGGAQAVVVEIHEPIEMKKTEEPEVTPIGIKRKMDREEGEEFKVSIEENSTGIAKKSRTDDGMTETFKEGRRTMTIDVSSRDIKERALKKAVGKNSEESRSESIRFYSQINPQQNENAEKELKRELCKSAFKEMNIIGQFNLGFIIASLDSDVFIIDQHASDEKYNFETLQARTKLETQALVVPKALNLTVEKEEIFLEHSDVIRKNGFDFVYDESEKPTNRIKLTSIPMSKNWVFGKEDVDELLFMLENAPDTKMCRPSRIRDMFASRACRKSVMIGTPLNKFEMKRIVEHMGEIEQPWNCPHGRPTIRHLVNLNMIQKIENPSNK